jgi:hypothetical protein
MLSRNVGTSPVGINEIPTPLAEAWNGVTWTVLTVPDPAVTAP